MLDRAELDKRFQLVFEFENYRRLIGTKEVAIHCHHYNARLQNIIEGAKKIKGKEIILSAAEEVFYEYVGHFICDRDNSEEKWQIAANLYAHLGYGLLDFSQINQGIVTATSSHFVEGWQAIFSKSSCAVCTFTEGYLQGVIQAITGKPVYVREEICMNMSADRCQFAVNEKRYSYIKPEAQIKFDFCSKRQRNFSQSNIDEQKVINALVEIPFYGNDEGLIPAFNVYLANMPADFYNLICIRFLKNMQEQNLLTTAQQLLLFAGEVCAINTLRGIIIAPEWYELIAPMVKEESDNLYGLIAVTNGLGWGNWHVLKYQPGQNLQMEALNGYEALGYLKYKGEAQQPQCFMFTGVAAGIMELLHGEGIVEERIGTYISEEVSCICCQQPSCRFNVEAL